MLEKSAENYEYLFTQFTSMFPLKARSKYWNQKTFYMGMTFDSKKEFERFLLLKDFQRQWLISELECQVPFQLIETFKYKGETILWVKYIADFVYKKWSEVIVEDVKSEITAWNPSYIIKKKLLLSLNPGINFVEII